MLGRGRGGKKLGGALGVALDPSEGDFIAAHSGVLAESRSLSLSYLSGEKRPRQWDGPAHHPESEPQGTLLRPSS